MQRIARWLALSTALSVATTAAQEDKKKSFDPLYERGGIAVYVKVDFDSGDNPFAAEGSGTVALASRPEEVVSGCSLHVRRARAGGYFGGRTDRVAVRGTGDLKVAFCVRARGMETVTVNLPDALQRDNTTPTSAARVQDGQWRTVVFAVEDFHFNSDPPERKVKAETQHTGLLFHGQERPGASGEYWIDKVMIYRGRDTQPPEAPTGVRASAGGGGKVSLSWTEPEDNAFAAVYSVHRMGRDGKWEKIGESIPPSYVDTVPEKGVYTYRITAADYDDNVSRPSRGVAVTATSAGKTVPPAGQVKDRMLYADNVRRIHAAGRGKVRHDVVLFAGDSITAADVYTHVLGGWLARGIPVRRGVGTMRTDYGKAMIGQYLAQSRPEFAVVMYGTNDSKSPQAVEQAMENLSAVIDACAQAGTVPIPATIPPRGFDRDQQDGQVRFNQALIRLCHRKKVPVSHCFEEMMGRDLSQMLGDGVHLRPVPGNEAAGEALWKTMQQVYFALRDTSGQWK